MGCRRFVLTLLGREIHLPLSPYMYPTPLVSSFTYLLLSSTTLALACHLTNILLTSYIAGGQYIQFPTIFSDILGTLQSQQSLVNVSPRTLRGVPCLGSASTPISSQPAHARYRPAICPELPHEISLFSSGSKNPFALVTSKWSHVD